jgi:hypothetical protein
MPQTYLTQLKLVLSKLVYLAERVLVVEVV